MQTQSAARPTQSNTALQAFLAVGLLAGGALAQEQGIASYEDDVWFWPTAPDAVYRDFGPIESDTEAVLFREQVGYRLDENTSLSVDASVLLGGNGFGDAESIAFGQTPGINIDEGLYDNGHWIGPGSEFDVYLLCSDRDSGSGASFPSGTITFAEEIVALQYLTKSLRGDEGSGGDGALGTAGTIYPGQQGDLNPRANAHRKRGLENNNGDWLRLSADRKVLEFRLKTSSYPDQIRIFTKPFAEASFEEYCFGDGSEGDCPCGRNAQDDSGTGCTNTSGEGARLQAFGTPTLEIVGGELRSDIELRITGMPTNRFCVLFAGDGVESNAVLFGDGLRCVRPGPQGGIFTRSRVKNSGQNGGATWENAATSFGMANANLSVFAPGDQIGFQGYYRDPNPDNCTPGQGFNLTNAVGMTFVGVVGP